MSHWPEPHPSETPLAAPDPAVASAARPLSGAAKAWLVFFSIVGVGIVGGVLTGIVAEKPVGGIVAFGCVIVGLIGFIAWVVWYRERQRALAMTQACQLMGFLYTPKLDKKELAARFGTLPVFGRGHGQAATSVMTGQVGDWAVILMDHQYTIGAGQHQHTHRQTVVVVPDDTGLPDFRLCPENLFHKIGKLFGYQDIAFETNKAFSERCLLRGGNEAAIRAAFSPEAQTYFANRPEWVIETKDGRLCAYQDGKRRDPTEVPEMVAEVLKILTMLRPGGPAAAAEAGDDYPAP